MAPERMVVIDSRTGCAGHGFMAVAAANAVERGADLAGAVAAARALREDLQISSMVDTLEYLRRGGRIGAASAWIGATLKVKPILTIEGEMQPVERVRTAGRAFERLVAHLEQRREDGCDAFAIQHIQAPDEAERLAERGPRDLRPRPGAGLGDRPGDRHPHRPGRPRRRRPAHGTARARCRRSPPRGLEAPRAVGVPLDPPKRRRSRRLVRVVPACSPQDHRPHAVHHGRLRALAVPDLPAAQADQLGADRDVPRGRAVGPGRTCSTSG